MYIYNFVQMNFLKIGTCIYLKIDKGNSEWNIKTCH